MKKFFILIFALGMLLFSCQSQKKEADTNMENPFFKEWTTPYGVPPFEEIKIEHFLPALKEGIAQREAEVDDIVANTAEPTFENTILPLDKSGELLSKVSGTFYPLNSANTNEEMQALAREISLLMTQHRDNISLNPELFKKIKSVYESRNELGLD
ncbi:MAG: peptidase M3, partial [Mariniphaga sp.]